MVQQVRIKDYGFQQLKFCVTRCMIKKGKLRTKQGKHHDIMQNVVVVFFFCVFITG